MPLRHAAPSPAQLHDSLHQLRKNNRTDYPISYLDTLMKTESKGIEAIIMRKRRIPFARFVARMEDMVLPKCVIFGELVENAGCV